MTSLVSWSEIGVGEEADAASDCTDLAVTSEAAPRSALAYGSECSCARCRRQVLICSRCDRGQHYCGARCSGLARRESLRGAARRYQQSRRDRHCHAERQRQISVADHSSSTAATCAAASSSNTSTPAEALSASTA